MIFYAIAALGLAFIFVVFLLTLGFWLVRAIRWMLPSHDTRGDSPDSVRPRVAKESRSKREPSLTLISRFQR